MTPLVIEIGPNLAGLILIAIVAVVLVVMS